MEIESFEIHARILKLDISSDLEVHPDGYRYDIYLGGISITTIEYRPDRPEQWYQLKGTLSRGDVAAIGEAIKIQLLS